LKNQNKNNGLIHQVTFLIQQTDYFGHYQIATMKNHLIIFPNTSRKLLVVCLSLLILNTLISFLYVSVSHAGAYHLDGTYVEPQSVELLKTFLLAFWVSIPILCLFFSVIVTFFIGRNTPYRSRYAKGYLATIVVVYGLCSLLGIVKLIVLVAG
jgi:hypothetical protein